MQMNRSHRRGLGCRVRGRKQSNRCRVDLQKTKKKHARIAMALTTVFAIGIAYMTLIYQSNGGGGIPWADKAFHAGAFFLLTLPSAILSRCALLWIVPFAAAFGIAIELVQPYVGRGREIADVYADLAGVASAVVVGGLIRRMAGR